VTDTGPRSIGLVVEAPADANTVRLLVDRVLAAKTDWVEDNIEHLRTYRGCETDTAVSYWKHIPALCEAHGVTGPKTHGKFDGKPGDPDARAARRALLLFGWLGTPDAVVLVRDADDQPERLDGLRQARDESSFRERVAIGVAVPEREAWHICGFIPSSSEEHEALRGQRQHLGFDPTLHPDRLGGEGKRNAKPVFAALTAGDPGRARRCLTEPALEDLRARGSACGLTRFLEELRERVAERLL